MASPVLFLFEMIEEIEVVSDYEINIHTSIPFAPLASHLAHNTGGIISKATIDAVIRLPWMLPDQTLLWKNIMNYVMQAVKSTICLLYTSPSPRD